MSELVHTHKKVYTRGDNAFSQWGEVLKFLNNGWQIVSAVESDTVIHFILLSPEEANKS